MRSNLRCLAVLVVVLSCSALLWAADFDTLFTGRTLRLDYFHSGNADEEHISIDELRLEDNWPGSRTRLLDDSNLGKYLFVVVDLQTQLPIYEDFVTPGSEPWEKNITALSDPARLKWRDLVDPATPIPTPWNQNAYDKVAYAFQKKRQELRAARASEEEMDRYFAEVKKITAPMLAQETYAEEVGAFEGAGYQAKGLYRSSTDCIMFTRNPDHFCPVCASAIEEVIDLYAD